MKNSMLYLVLIFALPLSQSAAASGYWSFLKSEADYESLYASISVGPECPFSESEMQSGLEGEFLRARIKPAKEWNNVFLSLRIQCFSPQFGDRSPGFIVSSGYRWCTSAAPDHSPQESGTFCRSADRNMWSYPHSASSSDVVNDMARQSNDAITEFIKQNM